jgi:hypothetical protein
MNSLLLLALLSGCGFFHTKASLEKAKKEAGQNVTQEKVKVEKTTVDSSYVKLDSKGEAKLYTFANKDLEKVSKVFVDVLQREGFAITYQDLYAGKIGAELVNKGSLATFNNSFAGNGNYKVSENTVVDLVLSPDKAGVQLEMLIKKVSVYSMGQEEAEAFNDLNLYKDIVAKVNLAL